LTAAEDALLICDARQIDLGHSGELFAYPHEHLAPKCVVLGAGLGGGVVNPGRYWGRLGYPKVPVWDIWPGCAPWRRGKQ
jgi:hypothetical protein